VRKTRIYAKLECCILEPQMPVSCYVYVKMAMQYVYYYLYMLLDVYGALQDQIGRVLGQNCKICTTDPKKLAISEIFR